MLWSLNIRYKSRGIRGKVTSNRKRCKIGKSCGATCINSSMICIVDTQLPVSENLSKLSDRVKNGSKLLKTQKSSGGYLDTLSTSQDFSRKLSDTDGIYSPAIKKMHLEMQKIFSNSNGVYHPTYADNAERVKYLEIRGKIEKNLGGTSLEDAHKAIKVFTSKYHSEVRNYQRGVKENKGEFLDKVLKKVSTDLENLLTSPSSLLPRPEVEKFRGFSVSPSHLKGMIQAVRDGLTLPGSATTSWTTSLPVAKKFSNEIRDIKNIESVILRTINKKGIPIESVSLTPEEYEVITSKSSKYKYLKYRPIEFEGDTYHVFDVKEM